jgi:hypothetical protein
MVVFALVTSDTGWGWYVTQSVWAAGSLGTATFYVLLLGYLRNQGDSFAVGSGPMIAFGLAVLALLVVAVLLGRAAPAGDAEPAEPA